MSETSYWRGYAIFLYQQAAESAREMRILDIGCGIGKGLELLSSYTSKQLVGIDNSKKAYIQAQQLAKGNLMFKLMEIENISKLRGEFGLITMFNTIEHLSTHQQQKALVDIRKLLTSNGTLMVATNNSLYTHVKNPFHLGELNGDELKTLLKRYFKIKMYGVNQKLNPEFNRDGILNRVVSTVFGNVFMQEYIQPMIPDIIKRLFNTYILKLKPETVSDFSLVKYSRDAENFLVICTHCERKKEY